MDQEVKDMEDHGSPKIHDFVDLKGRKESVFARVTLSDTRLHHAESNDRFSLREMDLKLPFGEIFDYGDWYPNNTRCYYKVIRLHANLYDAAGAVRPYTGKRLSYCYTNGRGPNLCLLDHVTRLLFCLDVKLFLPSFFDSVKI